METKEDFIIDGGKVKRVKIDTYEEEYELEEYLAEKEKELETALEGKKLYNQAFEEMVKNLKQQIRKLKKTRR